jgi:predicted enzyme related to lactoylglutathione lyase
MSNSKDEKSSGQFGPGKIGWNELVTEDPQAAIDYYTQMFGWGTEKYAEYGGPSDYTMFTYQGKPFGGVLKTPRPGAPTCWTNYVVVEDIDAMLEKHKKLGGSVCVGPMDIPGVGRIAVVKDPQGALIGMHQCAKA